jgi:hypothetical protein
MGQKSDEGDKTCEEPAWTGSESHFDLLSDECVIDDHRFLDLEIAAK